MKDLIMRGLFNFETLKYFVLDEADRMLDMEWIISQLPKERQTFLFSATVDRKVEDLAKRHLRRDYKFIKVITGELKPRIEERLIKLSSSGQKLSERIIIFVKTKKDARDIAEELRKRGFNIVSLHGDMTRKQRVVATDMVSRGPGIKEDPEVYIHRMGRTSRIGTYGKAYSLIAPEDSRTLWRIRKLRESYA